MFDGTAGRLIADMLAGDAYVLGRSLSSCGLGGAQLLGLAAGGLAIAALGAQHALLVTAGCHLVAALGTRLGLPNLPAPGHDDEQSLLGRSWRVNRVLLGDRTVLRLLLVMWLPPAFVTGGGQPAGSVRGRCAGSRTARRGCCSPACRPACSWATSWSARLLAPSVRERAVPLLVALLGLPLVGFAFALGMVALGALLVVTGFGFGYGLGVQRRFRDAVPEEVRGQAFALLSTGLMTLQGVGPAVFGLAAEVVPVGVAMAAGGVATVLTAGWIAHGDRREREQP